MGTKAGERVMEGQVTIPDVCKIINADITKGKVSDWLDRDWYVNIANKRINDFVE